MTRQNLKLPKNVVTRYSGNPILGLDDLPFRASDIHNAAAWRHKDRHVLLVTVENMEGYCSIYRAIGNDGRKFEIEPEPVLQPAREGPFARYEAEGVRDPRITRFGDTWYIMYLAQSHYGFRLALARSDDLEHIERVALVSEPDTKNGVLFPRKIKGKFARLERPREGGNVWVSYSEDLEHWGGWRVVMTPRAGYWDYHRIGVAVPPIETRCGWMVFYYGVKHNPSGPLFRLGVAFLDLEEPTRVLGRSNIPLLAPRETYERIGDVSNLVFSCGAIMDEQSQVVDLYYGASNSCICVGTVDFAALEQICLAKPGKEG